MRKETIQPDIRIIRPGHASSNGRANSSSMRLVEEMARWLDSKFVIPGTNIRFGLDPIISLVPVLGDLFSYLLSAALIYTMHNHGASRKVVIKMVMNSTLDAVIGSIPLIGSVFDVFYRSNDRNLRLLREHIHEGKHQGSGTGILVAVAIGSILLVAAAIFGIVKLFEAIF